MIRNSMTWLIIGVCFAVAAWGDEPANTVRCVAANESSPPDEAWRAQWIWGPASPNGPLGLFRKTFEVRAGLKSAWAQSSGDDGYSFYINSQLAKKGGFYWKRTDRTDVLSLLHEGTNVLGAEVMNAADPGGWLLELQLVYADGSEETIATDASWLFSAVRVEGWTNPGFDDTGWSACVTKGAPPAAAPWGELPHELLGQWGEAEVIAVSLPDTFTAGEPVQGYIDVKTSSPVNADSLFTLRIMQGRSEIYKRSWTLEPSPSQWGEGLHRITMPVDPLPAFLPKGEARIEYRLAGIPARKSEGGELTAKTVTLLNPQQGILTHAAVGDCNGAPTLFINNQPTFPMWFWQREILAEDAKAFTQAGVDVFTFCSPAYYLGPGWTGNDAYDYSEFDGIMLRFLEKAPNAYAVPRIFVSAPEWWIDAHPEEACRYANGVGWEMNGWGGTKHESFASALWKQDAGEALRRFIQHIVASPYSDRVIGMHVSNGIYGEWHTWSATDIPDTSEPMRKALSEYTRALYGADEAALRKAWGDAGVTFDTVTIPTLDERHAGNTGMFRDPSMSRKVADYYGCLHRATVDAIDHFCGIVKAESQGHMFTCVFYSYAPDLNWPQEGDHRAAAQAHRLSNVDVFSSPHSYNRRKLGEDGLFRNYPAALALHGKLFVDEADDRTSLAQDPPFTHVTTIDQSIEVVRREFGNAVTHGTGLWYMDQQDVWFHDANIMQAIANLKKWGDISMQMPRQSVAEVAVISDLESEFYLAGRDSGKNQVTFPLYDQQIGELCRSGAPFDWFQIEDLTEGRIPPHKVYIFLDAFYLTQTQRAAIDNLKAAGRTLLWFYAPGYASPEGLSLEKMKHVTGLAFKSMEQGKLSITCAEPAGMAGAFGWNKDQSPMFAPEDAAAAVWGHYTDTQTPALVVRDMETWRSVYCGVPGLPAAVLRKLFTEAGVHVYCDSGDNLAANTSWVMLHTVTAGRKTIHLPKPAAVYDIIQNAPVSDDPTETFEVELAAGTTAIYALNKP